MVSDRTFSIVVPKYDNSGKKINTDYHKDYADKMIEVFGGVSIIPIVLGCWKNDVGEVICEENAMMISARDYEGVKNPEKTSIRDKEFVKKLAEEIGNELGQASVMTEEDIIHDVIFVEGEYKKVLPEHRLRTNLFERYL